MLISSIMSIREFLGRDDNTRRVPATIEAGVSMRRPSPRKPVINQTLPDDLDKILDSLDRDILLQATNSSLHLYIGENSCKPPACRAPGGSDTRYTGAIGGLGTHDNGCPSTHPCKFEFKCCPFLKIRQIKVCYQYYCPNPHVPSQIRGAAPTTTTTTAPNRRSPDLNTRNLIEKRCQKK